MTAPDLRFIALGAGVQSTTVYLMAATGALEPRPDLAIFADTQSEPAWVYAHLDRLERRWGAVIPIRRVTAGSLEADTLASRDGRTRWAALPLFTQPETGDNRHGRLRRQCTREYKIRPLERAAREWLGLRPRQRAAGRFAVEEWIGISADEAHRAKPSRISWISSRWPLLDLGMTRRDCIDWLEQHGHPIPRKSACVFCPFHDDATWAWMKREAPAEFARACAFDAQLRAGGLRGVRGPVYVHRSLRPLAEVEFRPVAGGADELERSFGEECEGRCGV